MVRWAGWSLFAPWAFPTRPGSAEVAGTPRDEGVRWNITRFRPRWSRYPHTLNLSEPATIGTSRVLYLGVMVQHAKFNSRCMHLRFLSSNFVMSSSSSARSIFSWYLKTPDNAVVHVLLWYGALRSWFDVELPTVSIMYHCQKLQLFDIRGSEITWLPFFVWGVICCISAR